MNCFWNDFVLGWLSYGMITLWADFPVDAFPKSDFPVDSFSCGTFFPVECFFLSGINSLWGDFLVG